jgi:ectoine hydroxylase
MAALQGVTSDYTDAPTELVNLESTGLDFAEFAGNRLSPAQIEQFTRDGYLIVLEVLEAAEHERLYGLLARLKDQKIREGRHPEEDLMQACFTAANNLGIDKDIVGLLTQRKIFPKVVDILGTNISCYHAMARFDAPAPPGTPIPTDFDALPPFGFHQDSGLQNDFRNCRDGSHEVSPRISIKCAYYLSDMSSPGSGNTWAVPGSHLTDNTAGITQLGHTGGLGQPPGAIPICCPANSCLIFDRRLWHCVSPNWSQQPRVSLFYGYAYRWFKCKWFLPPSVVVLLRHAAFSL